MWELAAEWVSLVFNGSSPRKGDNGVGVQAHQGDEAAVARTALRDYERLVQENADAIGCAARST